ncbi:MAG: hypothetical protein LUC97_11845 [Clostridiales bacterium]|nr:hypothetical protein [Clostridiales bacterium]
MIENSLKRNGEGYSDPTAYETFRHELQLEKRQAKLIGVLKYIINQSGFSLEDRIILKDKKSGRTFY